jgi:photosystem II stability/assembly factor-like uncharacterized protein
MKLLLAFLMLCALASVAGAQWEKIYEPNDGSTTSMLSDGSNIFLGVIGGLFVSSDNGDSWSGIDTNLTNIYSVDAIAEMGGSIFAAMGDGGGVFRFTKNDTGWVAFNTVLPGSSSRTFVLSFAVEGNTLLGGTFTGTCFSADSGRSWQLLPSAPSYAEVLGTYNSEVFAAVRDSGIFRSSDTGASWIHTNTGLGRDSNFVESFFELDNDFLAGAGGDVFKYDMNDSSWVKLDSNLFLIGDISNFSSASSNLFMGTDGAGVWLSRDSGVSWSKINTGLTDTSIGAIAANSTYLFAGDYNGAVWRIPLSDFNQSGVAVSSATNSTNTISVFPNPATSSIMLLSANGPVSILDPLERTYEVPQSGNTLDISTLPSGAYFVSDGYSRAQFVKE